MSGNVVLKAAGESAACGGCERCLTVRLGGVQTPGGFNGYGFAIIRLQENLGQKSGRLQDLRETEGAAFASRG